METETAANVPKRRGRKPGSTVKPKIDLVAALNTEEGKALFKEAIAAALADKPVAPVGSQADAETLMRALAHEISNLGDQTPGAIKKLSAEEVTRREMASNRMYELIADAKYNEQTPEYELSRAIYFEEQIVDPTYIDSNHVLRRTRIAWPGIPNEAMAPVNDVARTIYREFIVSIGGKTPNVKAENDVLATKRRGDLSVLHKSDVEQAVAPVGKPRVMNEMQVLRKSDPDQVVETRVLGSVASPARQLA